MLIITSHTIPLMAELSIMSYVGAFIAVAIMLSVGTVILGNVSINCTDLSGTATTGWQGACEDTSTQTIAGYALLIVSLIVIAAVVILSVVRMLQ